MKFIYTVILCLQGKKRIKTFNPRKKTFYKKT